MEKQIGDAILNTEKKTSLPLAIVGTSGRPIKILTQATNLVISSSKLFCD